MQNREKMCASRSSRRALAGDLLERRARVLQIREDEFFRQRPAVRGDGRACASERARVRARPARCAGRS